MTPRMREYYAGALIALIGAGAAVQGYSYDFGSTRHIGPGFLPVVLGVVLIVLGAIIAVTQQAADDDHHHDQGHGHHADTPFDRRGGLAILAGVTAFIVFGQYVGLIPAIFFCVFISALGDRTNTLRSASLLALTMTVAGSLLFVVLLKIPFPLLRW